MDELFPEARLLDLLCTTTAIFARIASHLLITPNLQGSASGNAPRLIPSPFYARIWLALEDLHKRLTSLKGEDSKEWYKKLSCALDIYEDCVASQYGNNRVSKTHYGGLVWLEAQFRASVDGDEPGRFQELFLHMSEDRRSVLESTVAECIRMLLQATNSRLQSEIQIPSEDFRGLREWKLPALMGKFACELRQSLKQKLLRCRCAPDGQDGFNAEAKIAFIVYSEDSSASQICLRHHDTDNLWRSAILRLCGDDVPAPAAPVAGFRLWLPCATVCKALSHDTAHHSDSESLSSSTASSTNHSKHRIVRISGTRLELLRAQEAAAAAHVDFTAPLSHLCPVDSLSPLHESFPWSQDEHDARCVSLKQRLVIALRLAYTYVHLMGTEWWPLMTVRPNIWFAKRDLRLDTGRLFLDIQAKTFGETSGQFTVMGERLSSIESLLNSGCPSLPAFGKILLEVHRGAPCTWDEFLKVLDDCRTDENDPDGKIWADAAQACLDRTSLENLGELKHTFKKSVLARLHLLARRWNLNEESVFDMSIGSAKKRKLYSNLSVSATPELTPAQAPLPQTSPLVIHTGMGEMALGSHEDMQSANLWLKQFSEFRQELHNLSSRVPVSDPIRVAIIDTGARFDSKTTKKLFDDRIKGCWPDESHDFSNRQGSISSDIDGHGTSVTSLLLNVDQLCHVYVYRAFHTRSDLQVSNLVASAQTRIVEAMRHAVHEWKADIISLSFGFDKLVQEIEQSIRDAEQHSVLVFAASGNSGGNGRTSWPARQRNVIPVYASDGDGNPYKKNPTPQPNNSRFSALGVAVKLLTHTGARELLSGTSIATPVAVGIASTLIAFMRDRRPDFLRNSSYSDQLALGYLGESSAQSYDRLSKTMLTAPGMEAVFRLMAEERAGFNYLAPWKLTESHGTGVHLVTAILRALKEV